MSLDAVRKALAGAIEPPIDDVPPADDGGRPPRAMPEGCPVVPVGTADGTFYFLTALGELRALTPDKVANKHIVAMFAPDSQYLYDQWPRKKLVKTKDDDGNEIEEWIVTGWRNDDVAMLLMDVGAARGVWNPLEKVRGRGAWKDDRGGLILHCGNKVLHGGRWTDPGMIDAMVYPTQPSIPRPIGRQAATASAEDVAPELVDSMRARDAFIGSLESPAALLLELIKTWNWARPDIDPLLLLGWIAIAPFGGALNYRPLAWITGDAASGKSSLQQLLEWLFDGAILQSPEASEAGVRQTLGQQSLPVGLDEAEASGDNRKMTALITLARLAASSQGNLLRGGQDHKATEFRATSCFLFSSILVPPLQPADRSRVALLELGELPKGQRSPISDRHKPEINAIGRWMLQRIADRWQRWPGLLESFKDAMIEHGEQSGRASDQFGTLRAAAHLMLTDRAPDAEELRNVGKAFARSALSETSDDPREGPLCLDYLLSSLVSLDRGGQMKTVAHWVARAVAPDPAKYQYLELSEKQMEARQANDLLGAIGLRIVERKGAMGQFLAVAEKHQGLARLFDGQDCKYGRGVWTQALRRLPGAEREANHRIDHRQTKCTRIPIALVIQDEGADDAATVAREGVEA